MFEEPGEVIAEAGESASPVDVDTLTGLVGWLGRADGTGSSDADLIGQLDALERVKSACAAAQARLTDRFVASQAAEARRLEQQARACSDAGDFDGWVAARDAARARTLPPDPALTERPGRMGQAQPGPGGEERAGQGRWGGSSRSRRRRAAAIASRTGVSAQVGLARHESPARGARLARAAVTLVADLPHTLAALAAGHLSERRAEIIVKATSHLTREQRAVVDAEVIGGNTPGPDDPAGTGCAGWGDRQVEARVRACADRLDPAAATERARRARADRHVSVRPVPDCMAVVSALLPVEMAVAIHAALAQAAAAAKAAGDPRSRGQVMADTLHERVTGQASAGADLDLEVQVVITDRALFDGGDTPGHVPGYGPVPAGWVRDLLTRDLDGVGTAQPPPPPWHAEPSPPPGTAPPRDAGTADPLDPGRPPQSDASRAAKTWLRRLYTHPGTGTLVGMDSTRRLFPAGLRRFLIARDGVCRTPWCDAPIGHADHIHPHARGGPTSDTNGQGLSVGCNLTKDLPGWHTEVTDPGPTVGSDGAHTVRITTPTGHTYTSSAPPLLPGHHDADQPEPPTARAVVIELYRPARSARFPIEADYRHPLAG